MDFMVHVSIVRMLRNPCTNTLKVIHNYYLMRNVRSSSMIRMNFFSNYKFYIYIFFWKPLCCLVVHTNQKSKLTNLWKAQQDQYIGVTHLLVNLANGIRTLWRVLPTSSFFFYVISA